MMLRCSTSPIGAALLVLLALLCLVRPASAAAADPPGGFRWFAADSVWNLALRDDAPVHPDSAAMVAGLRESVGRHGTWINSSTCGMAIYWAKRDTPRVAVTLAPGAYQDKALARAWASVPIPARARPAHCPDRNLTVAQVQTDGTVTAWEFWAATKHDGTWSAKWGGVTQDVENDSGYASPLAWTDSVAPVLAARRSTRLWNVTASSAAMMAGVITAKDLAAGHIDHALAFAVSNAARGRWMWPAQRGDGMSDDPAALPEGAHLRIDPQLDLAKRHMTPLVRMIAEAAQKYGIIVRDKTGGPNVFILEEPPLNAPSSVPPLLDGKYPNTALKAFPWNKLRILDAPTCSSYSPCQVTPRARVDVDTCELRVGERVVLDTRNSSLNQPRADVQWDLDGDGSYEVHAGRSATHSFRPAHTGVVTVAVKITTRDGQEAVGTRELMVAGAGEVSASRPPVLASSDPSPSVRSLSVASPTVVVRVSYRTGRGARRVLGLRGHLKGSARVIARVALEVLYQPRGSRRSRHLVTVRTDAGGRFGCQTPLRRGITPKMLRFRSGHGQSLRVHNPK